MMPMPPRKGVDVDADRFPSTSVTGFEHLHDHARLGSFVTKRVFPIVSSMFTSPQCGVILSLPVRCSVRSDVGVDL